MISIATRNIRGNPAVTPLHTDAGRISEVMEQYRDTPVDLGDASLVAVAESVVLRRWINVD